MAPRLETADLPVNTIRPKEMTQTATNFAGRANHCHPFYVWDQNKLKFLVDTSAAISMIPYTNELSAKPTLFRLQAANSSHIETYSSKFFTLNIDMQYDYTWPFILVNIKTPILDIDFLVYYEHHRNSYTSHYWDKHYNLS